jgi:ketosteroid isomerase-like protein
MIGVRRAIISGIVVVTAVIQVPPMALVYSSFLTKPTPKSEIEKAGERISEHKSELDMDQRVKAFFLRYEKANSSSDVSAIGGLYADTFMFGGPNGVQAIKKEDFLKVVPKMKVHFSSMGLSETQLQTVETNPLDSKYLLAKVVWRIKFRNSFGSKHVDASATYVLAHEQGDALSIVFQIDHQDLASVIKGQQNTQQ